MSLLWWMVILGAFLCGSWGWLVCQNFLHAFIDGLTGGVTLGVVFLLLKMDTVPAGAILFAVVLSFFVSLLICALWYGFDR